MGLLNLSYTFIGSPPGNAFRNTFGWSVGLSYDVTSAFTLAGYVDGATAVSRTQPDPLDARLVAEYKLNKRLNITSGATAGLSKGSPDFSILAGLRFRF